MKKHILAACSIAVISGAGLAAQQPQPITPPTQQTPPSQPAQRPPDPSPAPNPTSQPPATRPASPASDLARTATTVTGCLKTWDSRTMAPARGSGSGSGSAAAQVSSTPTGTPGAAAQFVLSNIERSGAASSSGASSFLLKTSDSSVSFSQHLNHKVELTGTVSDSAPVSGTDKPMADKPSEARDAAASGRVGTEDMKLPTLNVTALKMLSPTCGTGSN